MDTLQIASVEKPIDNPVVLRALMPLINRAWAMGVRLPGKAGPVALTLRTLKIILDRASRLGIGKDIATLIGTAPEILDEDINDPADLPGVQRSLWSVEIPDAGYGVAALPDATLRGDRTTYPTCQSEAIRLRNAGHTGVKAPSAALIAGGASGWECAPNETMSVPRDGFVYVTFATPVGFVGWPVVEAGQPPARILPLVHYF